MNEGVNVRSDDILWRFYCKRFLVEGKEIEPPKNLCQYFWTSVKGFGLWFGCEIKLWSLWLIGLMATAILFAMARGITDTNNTVTDVLIITITVLCGFMLLTAMFVTLYRVKRLVEARVPWVMHLLGFCTIVIGIVYAATQGILWPGLMRLFGDIFQWMGYMLMVMAAAIIIALILSTISHGRLQKLQRVFQTFGAFASAKKNRVCPRVNPPEDFKTGS